MITPSSMTASSKCAPPNRPVRWSPASDGASIISSVFHISKALDEPVTTTQDPGAIWSHLELRGLVISCDGAASWCSPWRHSVASDVSRLGCFWRGCPQTSGLVFQTIRPDFETLHSSGFEVWRMIFHSGHWHLATFLYSWSFQFGSEFHPAPTVQWHAVTTTTSGSVQLQVAILRQRSQHGRLSHRGLTEGQLLEDLEGEVTLGVPIFSRIQWNQQEIR